MKKRLLTAAICGTVALGIAATASAVPVQFNSGSWLNWGRTYTTADLVNYTGANSNPYSQELVGGVAPVNNPAQALVVNTYSPVDGTEDSWGAAEISKIFNLNTLGTIWETTATQEMTLFYTQGDDVMIQDADTTDLNPANTLLSKNFVARIYLDNTPDYDETVGTAGRDSVVDGTIFTGATEGTLLLELTGHSRWADYDGSGTETEEYSLKSIGDLGTGLLLGTVFLDVNPAVGAWASLYDTNTFDVQNDPDVAQAEGYGFADFRLSISTQPTPAGNTTGWNLFGTGEAQADLNHIPEPATMLLLGTGLVGIAGSARRRKTAKKA